jgi:uncharacterized damage-inducible protein DinB
VTASLRRTFAWEGWANREALASLRRMDAPPAAAVRWLAHVAAAQQLWRERVRGLPQGMPVWPDLALDEIAPRLDEAERRWAALLAELESDGAGGGAGDALARPVSYVNTKGERFTSPLGDVLVHVTHHGAYHRGQIAAAVRAAGGEPAYTDFIHAARTGMVE